MSNPYVSGDKELIAALKKLDNKSRNKAIKKGTREGCKVVLAEAKALVSVDTGATKASLKVRAMKRSKKSFGTKVTTSEGLFKGKEFYAGFVELGHKLGKRGSRSKEAQKFGVDKRAIVKGQHKMRQAALNKGEQALEVAVKEIWDVIEQDWKT